MILRYSLHSYLYTLTHFSSQSGTPILRPMFYDYPEDDRSYNNVLENVMLGDAIKFSPIFWPTSNYRISIYFPGTVDDMWCPLNPDEIV